MAIGEVMLSQSFSSGQRTMLAVLSCALYELCRLVRLTILVLLYRSGWKLEETVVCGEYVNVAVLLFDKF